MFPMKCRPLEGDPERLLSNPVYALEVKMDGDRMLIDCRGEHPIAFNREGGRKDIPLALRSALSLVSDIKGVLDGELIKDSYWVFDAPYIGHVIAPHHQWQQRRAAIDTLFENTPIGRMGFRLGTVTLTKRGKQTMATRIRNGGFEGYVLKHIESKYVVGPRKTGSWLKWKNVRTVDCFVTALGTDKRNAELALYDGDGNEVPVGTASRLEGDGPWLEQQDPAVIDDLIKRRAIVYECAILNCGDEGGARLYQPHLRKRRTDKSAAECTVDQLDGKYRVRQVPT